MLRIVGGGCANAAIVTIRSWPEAVNSNVSLNGMRNHNAEIELMGQEGY